jgi:ribonuclease VapC
LVNLVVDTSAAVAVLLGEPERGHFRDLLLASNPAISAGSLIELLRISAVRKRRSTSPVWTFLELFSVQVVPVNLEQARLAEEGNLRFGKGRRQPPAALNFGDLFAYALARQLDAPLLFKGNDFGQTDVKVAIPSPPVTR